MVNPQPAVDAHNRLLIDNLRSPDIPRVYSLYSHLNSLNLYPYFQDVLERDHPYSKISLGVIFHTETEDQKRLLKDIRNARGTKLTLGDHSFKASFGPNEWYGIGRAILVPVRTFWEQIPFTKKPIDIDLFLASPEEIRTSFELMDIG